MPLQLSSKVINKYASYLYNHNKSLIINAYNFRRGEVSKDNYRKV